MKRIAFALCALLVAASTAHAEQEYQLAQVADGRYDEGSFKTTFVLFNPNDATVTARISLTDDGGSPLRVTIPQQGTASEFTVTLGAGATRILQTDGSGSLTAGAARVTSSLPIGVSSIFTVYDTAGRFVTEAGVGSSQLVTRFSFPVDTTGTFNTGIALFNGGTAAASITLRLLDTSGQEVATTTLSLNASAHRAVFAAGPGQLFPSNSNFRGTVAATSSSAIAVLPLRQNQSAAALSYTSLPAVSSASTRTEFNLAQVANGTFSDGSFRTSFLLFNVSSSTANVALTLTKDDGTPFAVTIGGRGTASTFNVSLPPGGVAFLETDGGGALTAGAATITSNVPVGAAAIFSVFDPQGRFLTEAGVGDSPELTRFTIPVDVTGDFNTAIAFFNRGAVSTALSLKLLDAGGVILGTSTLSLVAKGHRAVFVTDLFAGTNNLRGSLTVSASAGVTALTLRQNATPLSYTTLPATEGAAGGLAPARTLLSESRSGVDATADATVNVTLPAGFRISGNITGPGTPSAISATGTDKRVHSGVINAATRRYLIVVPAGTFSLTVCFTPGSGGAGSVDGTLVVNSVQVDADTTRDLALPSVSLTAISGTIASLPPVSGFLRPSMVFTSADLTSGGAFTIAENGTYQGQLPPGSYTASVTIPFFGDLTRFQSMDLYDVGSVSVAAAAVVANFTAPGTAKLSGTVRVSGMSLPMGTSVMAYDNTLLSIPAISCAFPSGTSMVVMMDTTGAYQLTLRSGRAHAASVMLPLMAGAEFAGSILFPTAGSLVTLAGDATLDFNVPALPQQRVISGRITDGTGKGVEGVSVTALSTAVTGAANTGYSAAASTDASGNYRLTVLSGTYDLEFTPVPPNP